MMTEEEARKKICQESFGVSEIRDGNDNGIREGGPWRCMTTQCMAWRWDPIQSPASVGETWEKWNAGDSVKRRGFCGKAGQP